MQSAACGKLQRCVPTPCAPPFEPRPQTQVNRLAQKTDAGQLSRNLLLVPRATVNLKPNLQIIADDVKCTHGAAISDLSEEELFYFRWGLQLCWRLGFVLCSGQCRRAAGAQAAQHAAARGQCQGLSPASPRRR